MKKVYLFLALLIIAVSIFAYWKFSNSKKPQTTVSENPQTATQTPTPNKIDDEALKNALNAYAKAKTQGVINLTSGPCLGIVAPDWVADIAHNPRQATDDEAQNQCAEFKSGQVHHFIELDPDGKLIRTY